MSRILPLLAAAALVIAPLAGRAQGLATQGRSGMGDAEHPSAPSASQPAGSVNAASGPQAHPAYPSGSTTPNPGAAFVRTTPVPATGPVQTPPSSLSTTTTTGGVSTKTASPGVGQAATPPR